MLGNAAIVCLALTSTHAEHQALFGDRAGRSDVATARQAAEPRRFDRVVFGYLPYWSDAADVPWSHLTHLAHFAVSVNTDGSLGDDHGWSGTRGEALVAAGESWGVPVVLVATLFDTNGIGTLLSSAAARTALVDNLLSAVEAQGGRGVNIDFETVPLASKQVFVDFMGELTTAFHAAIPGSHVSLASPAVDWSGAYDFDALALATDGLAIMGYDYYWSGSNPGPCSPVDSGALWGSRNLRWTVNDYLTFGGEANRGRMFLGFPLYGRDWPSTGTSVPGTRTANGTAVLYAACQEELALHGKSWDEDSQTPYAAYMDGSQAHQMFCEDDASLEAKLDLVLEYDLGGVMFWALGYVPPDGALWDAIDTRFAAPNEAPVAAASAPASVTPGTTVTLDASGSYDPDLDPLTFRWLALEGPPVSIDGFAGAIATAELAEAGTYVVEVTVSDGELETSAAVTIVAGTTPPPETAATAPPPADPADACDQGCSALSAPLWLGILAAATLRRRRR
jgi:GH18 family chitinase